MARALAWVSRITTISLQMVVPAVIGYWIDRRLTTIPLFTLFGSALGMVSGMLQLVRITKEQNSRMASSGADRCPQVADKQLPSQQDATAQRDSNSVTDKQTDRGSASRNFRRTNDETTGGAASG